MILRLMVTFVLSIVVLASCKTDPKRLTANYIEAVNHYDSGKINKCLDKNFRLVNSPFSYGSQINIDSFKTVKGHIQLISSVTKGYTVQTTEQWASVYDSLLLMKTKLILHNTYQFNKDRIKSITITKAENLTQYKNQIEDKFKAFKAYVDFEHADLSEIEKRHQAVTLMIEFSRLSSTAQKEYLIRAYLKNSEFVSDNNIMSMGLTFTGKRTVLVNLMGMTIGSTYSIDEDIIQIDQVPGNYAIPLVIKDNNTMIGKALIGEYIFKRVH